MKRLALAALLALPSAALAEDQLDRLEEVSEQANIIMMMVMAAEVQMDTETQTELIASAAEQMQWDAPMRAAGECMLDGYRGDIGADGLDELLTNMETMIADMAEMTSLDDFETLGDVMPDGMTEERSMEITRDCGMLDLQMAKMSESGFVDAMMAAAMAAEGN